MVQSRSDAEMLVPGRYLFVYGIYYPEHEGYTYEAQYMVFPAAKRITMSLNGRIGGSSKLRLLAIFT